MKKCEEKNNNEIKICKKFSSCEYQTLKVPLVEIDYTISIYQCKYYKKNFKLAL